MELPFGQLSAGYIAVLLGATVVVALLRSRSRAVLVGIALLVAVPLAGFISYAIVPGPPPQFAGPLLSLALLGAAIAFFSGAALVAIAIGWRRALTPQVLSSLSVATVGLWVGISLALSAFVAQWQPPYGIANFALTVAWALYWLPNLTRRIGSTSSTEIAAPRVRVYAFLSRPDNWPRYDEDLISVDVQPPGQLIEGSEIVAQRRLPSPVRGPRMLASTLESRTRITRVVPGESITSRQEGLPNSSTLEFADIAQGTRITTRAIVTVPYRMAFLGAVLVLRAQRRQRIERAKRNLERLKQILETDTAQ